MKYSPVATISQSHKPEASGHSQIQSSWFQRNRTLLWMLIALLCGVGFATAHHCFYASFDGKRVDTASINQIWIVRIGTGLAFITKTMFVVAASLAYVQYQWLAIRSQTLKIKHLDCMVGILRNASCFFESAIWIKLPLLSLVAGVAW
jgi:hypothetical protein